MTYHPITGFPITSDDARLIRNVCLAIEGEVYAAKGARERKDHARAIWLLRGIRFRLMACKFRRQVLDLYQARKAASHG